MLSIASHHSFTILRFEILFIHVQYLPVQIKTTMAPSKALDAEACLDYLLLLISKSELKPDYHATAAAAAEITSANNAYAISIVCSPKKANFLLVRRNSKRLSSKAANTSWRKGGLLRWKLKSKTKNMTKKQLQIRPLPLHTLLDQREQGLL